MPVPKGFKIDLDSEYPCPCRRAGELKPIMLTEAFGCDRCQRIFVVQDDNQELEELSGAYPNKRAWRWNGTRWVPVHSCFGEVNLPIPLLIIPPVLVTGLLLTFQSSLEIRLVLILLALLVALMAWLAHQHY